MNSPLRAQVKNNEPTNVQRIVKYCMDTNCAVGWAVNVLERERRVRISEQEIYEANYELNRKAQVEKKLRMNDNRWVD